MTNRVQSLRSNVAGNRPTGRLPGELYVNWPDGQLGTINAASNAQDLIAIRFFSTGASYNVGDHVIQGGFLYRAIVPVTPGAFNITQWALAGGGSSITIGDTPPANPQTGAMWWDSVGGNLYVWYNDGNSSQWVVAVNVANAIPIASTTKLGGVKVDGTTITAATDGTISTIPAQNRNRLINGAFNIDQWNNHVPVAMPTGAGFFACDRWKAAAAQASKLSMGASLIASPLPFTYYLRFAVTASYTPVAAEVWCVYQRMVFSHTADWGWGASNASPVTLSFLVSVGTGGGGTYSGSIRNAAGSRSYVFTFPVQANLWTPISITIPGDITGTWLQSDPNAVAVDLLFDLGCGSTYRSTAGSWQAGNFIGATGAQQFVTQAVNNILQFANIQLEVGSQATPFDWRSPTVALAECQRYYSVKNGLSMTLYGVAGTTFGQSIALPVTMRTATPIITPVSPAYSNASGLTTSNVTQDNVFVYATITATGGAQWSTNLTANAEI